VTEHRCARCGGPVDVHDTYVIGYCKANALEWIYLCEDCEVLLREWLARET
jgi:hypothetical protein